MIAMLYKAAQGDASDYSQAMLLADTAIMAALPVLLMQGYDFSPNEQGAVGSLVGGFFALRGAGTGLKDKFGKSAIVPVLRNFAAGSALAVTTAFGSSALLDQDGSVDYGSKTEQSGASVQGAVRPVLAAPRLAV